MKAFLVSTSLLISLQREQHGKACSLEAQLSMPCCRGPSSRLERKGCMRDLLTDLLERQWSPALTLM